MKNIFSTFIVVLILFLVSGCSSKKYFEPENIEGSYSSKGGNLSGKIIDFNRYGATLSNNQFITSNGIINNKAENGFFFINQIDNITISADLTGKVAIDNKIITLDNIVIGATLKGDTLAVIYIDNSIAIYDLTDGRTKFKEYLGDSLANDTRITNPIFMSDLVLFPSLNGKVVVFNIAQSKILREIIIDATNKQFKNIIFFDIVDEQLIAATANSILSIGVNLYAQNYEIKDVATKDNKIYIATIDGEIIVMDNTLRASNSQKFKFAKIYGLGFGKDHIYGIEHSGYIIKMDMNLNNSSVMKLDFSKESKLIIIDNKAYFDNKFIYLD
ncbi:lipoprotein [Arcobacter sp. FWKO B]|uniref:LptM family lipoprotein n=1 Tax=Arcobacter sp. FWKO B TaxID=2593672 RepID=UPI0018A4CCA9|nr:hypothetical protein [Arcobacter sp. FWKO B]QOG12903.1 hypothetical protein FWKOB_09445 [Arcobacter sp. FWKO B]